MYDTTVSSTGGVAPDEDATTAGTFEAAGGLSVHRRSEEVGGVNPLRGRPRVRDWLRRELVSPGDLVAPVLVQPDDRDPREFPALPTAVAVSSLGTAVGDLWMLGIGAIKLFCYVADKREDASAAIAPDNLMLRAIRIVRDAVPDMVIETEVCGCAWTSTGECVLVDIHGTIDLAATLDLMARMAVLHADAGADVVGPAAVLDGSVARIRVGLDEAGHHNVGITPSVIFDSALFGPYKEPMHTDPGRGHRRGFQIDACHVGQALDCAHRWLAEGADSLLVQPAMMSVDLLARLRAETNAPITAFSVSGEHLMLGDNDDVYLEYLRALRRAGADLVMTYGAAQLAAALGPGRPR
jgi:porphobilinogen synthase